MKRWIAFDAAETLFHPAEPVATTYARTFSKYGIHHPPAAWKQTFKTAFTTAPDPIFTPETPGETTERQWWKSLVATSCKALGETPPTPVFENAFDELFKHYAHGSAWKLFPETAETLASLHSQTHGLAIASNFDSRLHQVLRDLKIHHFFTHIFTSADVSARKPSPKILQHIMRETHCPRSHCCLVGDSTIYDQPAAKAAGIAFYLINRPNTNLQTFQTWFEKHPPSS